MKARWDCPHCGSEITDTVNWLISVGTTDGDTTYHTCGSCKNPVSLSVQLDVHIGKQSFEEAHPELAAKIAAEREAFTVRPASRR